MRKTRIERSTLAECGPRGISAALRTPTERKINSRALLPALLVSALLILSPAVNAQGGNPTQFLFALNGGQNPAVQTYTVDPVTGALAPITAPPAPFRSYTGMAVVNRAGTFLFGASTNSLGNPVVTVLAIASDGSVSELPASPFAGTAAAAPEGIAVSPDGLYLYLSSANPTADPSFAGVVDVFSIASDGSLTPLHSYPFSVMPHDLYLHPTGSWLYVLGETLPAARNSVIERFNVGVSGTLTDMGAFALETYSISPTAFTGTNTGTFLFAVHGQLGGSETFTDSVAVNPVTGALSLSSIFDNGGSLPQIERQYATVDATGNFLFTSFGLFSITNGQLTQLQSFSSSAPYPPLLVAASPNRSYLFSDGVVNQLAVLSSDVIGTSGSLTPAPGSPYRVNLYSWAIAVSGSAGLPNAPAVTLSPTTLPDFGSIVTGHNKNASFSITNSGFGTLSFTSIAISGDPSFTQTNNCPPTLVPAVSCVVNVTFAPTSVGTFTASAVITSNAPTASIALSGMGINPYPIPGYSPQSLTFPDTAIGSRSPSQTFTVSNDPNATAPLVLGTITLTGSNPNDFSETNNCTAPIAAGGSCSIQVTFSPLALGARIAAVLVAISPGNSFAPTVSGNGVVTPVQYTLQTAAVGPGTIQQSPSGSSFNANTPITLTAVPNSNAMFSTWSGGACSGSASAVCTFTLTANTAVTATFTANPAVTVSQPSQTGAAGGVFTFTINEAGFATTPALTATCSIPQGSCTISGTTLTVTTTKHSAAVLPVARVRVPLMPALILAFIFSLAIVLLWANPCVLRPLRPAMLVGGLVLFAAFGCSTGGSGGGGLNPSTGTPAGTYQITIHATAGTQSATVTVTLTVQ